MAIGRRKLEDVDYLRWNHKKKKTHSQYTHNIISTYSCYILCERYTAQSNGWNHQSASIKNNINKRYRNNTFYTTTYYFLDE